MAFALRPYGFHAVISWGVGPWGRGRGRGFSPRLGLRSPRGKRGRETRARTARESETVVAKEVDQIH